MTGVAVSMDSPHADAGSRHGDDGGEAGLTKYAMVSESEDLLENDNLRPRFLQPQHRGPWYTRISKKVVTLGQVVLFGIVVVQFVMLYRHYAAAAAAVAADMVDAGVVRRQSASAAGSSSTSNVPDYYVTDPLLLPGEFSKDMVDSISLSDGNQQVPLQPANLLSSLKQTLHLSHQRHMCRLSHWRLKFRSKVKSVMMRAFSTSTVNCLITSATLMALALISTPCLRTRPLCS